MRFINCPCLRLMKVRKTTTRLEAILMHRLRRALRHIHVYDPRPIQANLHTTRYQPINERPGLPDRHRDPKIKHLPLRRPAHSRSRPHPWISNTIHHHIPCRRLQLIQSRHIGGPKNLPLFVRRYVGCRERRKHSHRNRTCHVPILARGLEG